MEKFRKSVQKWLLIAIIICFFVDIIHTQLSSARTFTIENAVVEPVVEEIHVGDPVNLSVIEPATIEMKVKAAFPEEPEVAWAVARAESQGDPSRVGDLHITFEKDGREMGMSCGVFQIRVLPGRPDCHELQNEDFNIAYARQLYEKSGWQPWSSWKNKAYLRYL